MGLSDDFANVQLQAAAATKDFSQGPRLGEWTRNQGHVCCRLISFLSFFPTLVSPPLCTFFHFPRFPCAFLRAAVWWVYVGQATDSMICFPSLQSIAR